MLFITRYAALHLPLFHFLMTFTSAMACSVALEIFGTVPPKPAPSARAAFKSSTRSRPLRGNVMMLLISGLRSRFYFSYITLGPS